MRYSAPLDGIRGIAIVTVFLAHYGIPFLQRGGFGVDIFFTLSGYLITTILLSEYTKTGDVSFRNFYIRRVLRLFPALLFLLVVYGSLVTLFGKNLTRHFTDIAMVFFYVANFAGAAGLNRPGELGHTWSLYVEEQFYLIWPVTLFFLLKKWGARGGLYATVFLALVSMAEMFFLAPSQPWWRLYYGFDTRAFTLLFGCTFAILIHFWKDRARLPNWMEVPLPLLASTGIALIMLHTDAFTSDPDFFQGKIFAIPLFTCGLLYAAIMPGFSRTKEILSIRPLIYFGKRSYGLYLWHYWILNVVNSTHLWIKILCALGSLIITELSYRFVEIPFLSLKDKWARDEKPIRTVAMDEANTA